MPVGQALSSSLLQIHVVNMRDNGDYAMIAIPTALTTEFET